MTNRQKTAAYGRDVLPFLAAMYPQLYVAPAEDALETYRTIVLSGEDAPSHSLDHFVRNEQDSAVYETTPAGDVLAVTLYERTDFETFLQIITGKCQPITIPATQGASMIDGIISWQKIRAHETEFLAEGAEKGIDDPDWDSEFKRFTSDKKNYTDAMLVLSSGPYSAVSGREFGIDEDTWKRDSVTIRKYHELNHFICRRLWPEKIAAVWDELVADAVGIYAAYGHYDIAMAERFLGIQDCRYTGGRLENYVSEEDPEQKAVLLKGLAEKIHPVLQRFESIIQANEGIAVFELIPKLEDTFTGEITA